jgi:DNA-binding FrmR family transcriptional regulator
MDNIQNEKIKINLKKAEGQIKLINKMLDEKRYCVDVAQQINAAIGLLKKANTYILEQHLISCGAVKLSAKNMKERTDFAEELIRAFNINNK